MVSLLVNEEIRAAEVFLIEERETVSLADAMARADELELDLVEFSRKGNVSYCKLLDYGKYQYEQQRKERKQRAGNKPMKQKTIEVEYGIADRDLGIRAGHADEWLSKGMQVTFQVKFRGRQQVYMNTRGPELVERFLSMLAVGYKVVSGPTASGRMYSVILRSK